MSCTWNAELMLAGSVTRRIERGEGGFVIVLL